MQMPLSELSVLLQKFWERGGGLDQIDSMHFCANSA